MNDLSQNVSRLARPLVMRLRDWSYGIWNWTWRLYPLVEAESPFEPDDFGGETVGYCSRCGEAREAFYTCREGGETIPKAGVER